MRFTAAAALIFGATALAETVNITKFTVHKDNGAVDSYSFHLSGDEAADATCSASGAIPSDTITCGETKYRFQVSAGVDDSTFNLKIFHELSTAAGSSGVAAITTNCRSGGGNTNVCEATAPSNVITLTS
ncbi:hypothetical protein F5X96DRAFT_682464 [Biscogniauxia mediterranea]|nr:hypothetical protein F5X96DRAFT_682464 [Biscogniauxia mediterranea]